MKILENVSRRLWPINKSCNSNQWKWNTGTKGGFISMLLGTLGARLLRDVLSGKGVIKDGDVVHRAGQDF